MPKVITDEEQHYLQAIAEVKGERLGATMRSYVAWCLGGWVELPKLIPLFEAMDRNLHNLKNAKKRPVFDAGD